MTKETPKLYLEIHIGKEVNIIGGPPTKVVAGWIKPKYVVVSCGNDVIHISWASIKGGTYTYAAFNSMVTKRSQGDIILAQTLAKLDSTEIKQHTPSTVFIGGTKMVKTYSSHHIGKSFVMDDGAEMIVVAGGSKQDWVTVRSKGDIAQIPYQIIKDNKYKRINWNRRINKQTDDDRLLVIKLEKEEFDPRLFPSVQGFGFVGTSGKYSRTLTPVIYKIWQHMLERSYCPKYHDTRPTYRDVTTCVEWHNLSIFGIWCDEHHVDGYHLDKDILSGPTKIYSPETCIFVPPGLNAFISANTLQMNNTSGYIGVSQRTNGEYVSTIHTNGEQTTMCETFDKDEAHVAREAQRAIEAQKWKDAMKGILPQKAIDNIK